MNTKYISSNVLKISVILRVHSTSEIADICNTWNEIVWYLPTKVNFSDKGKFFPVILVNFAWLSAFSGYNIWCKHSVHIENCLKCHFNEWMKRNLGFKKAA